jgi:phage terminase small subunit
MTQRIPEGLGEAGKTFWVQANAERSFEDVHDLAVLETLCRLRDQEKEYELRLQTDGAIFKDRWGRPKAHPVCKLLGDTRILIMRAIRELGLSIVTTNDPRLPGIY